MKSSKRTGRKSKLLFRVAPSIISTSVQSANSILISKHLHRNHPDENNIPLQLTYVRLSRSLWKLHDVCRVQSLGNCAFQTARNPFTVSWKPDTTCYLVPWENDEFWQCYQRNARPVRITCYCYKLFPRELLHTTTDHTGFAYFNNDRRSFTRDDV